MNAETNRKGKKMTQIENINYALKGIKLGFTTTVWGVVVTRHDSDVFEIGSIGNDDNTANLKQTARNILYMIGHK